MDYRDEKIMRLKATVAELYAQIEEMKLIQLIGDDLTLLAQPECRAEPRGSLANVRPE